MKTFLERVTVSPRIFTKTQHRVLVERLEHYYAYLLYKQDVYKENFKHLPKTSLMLADRDIRAKLKSCEILLISLNSKLFENVKTASIRKTRTIEGRLRRPLENRR